MDKEMLDAMRQMMKEELEPIKADIGGLKADVSGLKADVSGLKAEVAEIKEDARHTRVLVEAHDEKFQLIHEAQAETAAKFGQLERMEQTLNDVKSEVEVIRDVVRFHSSDIATLKKAAL